MKGLCTGIIVLLVVIFSFSVFMYIFTSNISADLEFSLKQLHGLVEREQWKEAVHCLEELNKKWSRADAWWTPLMDHREIEVVDLTLVRLCGYVRLQQKEDALVDIESARRMIQRLHERESPSIKNIF